jgi:hypothetical protein
MVGPGCLAIWPASRHDPRRFAAVSVGSSSKIVSQISPSSGVADLCGHPVAQAPALLGRVRLVQVERPAGRTTWTRRARSSCLRCATGSRRGLGHPGAPGSRGGAPAAGGVPRVVGPEALPAGGHVLSESKRAAPVVPVWNGRGFGVSTGVAAIAAGSRRERSGKARGRQAESVRVAARRAALEDEWKVLTEDLSCLVSRLVAPHA